MENNNPFKSERLEDVTVSQLGLVESEPVYTRPTVKPSKARKHAITGVVLLVILLILTAIGGLILTSIANKSTSKERSYQPAGSYKVQDIKLDELSGQLGDGLVTSQTLSVNGQLRANNSIFIKPTDRPKGGALGQVYFDKDSAALAYYNGAKFVGVANNDQVSLLQNQIDSVEASIPEQVDVPSSVATQTGNNVFSGSNSFGGTVKGTNISLSGSAAIDDNLTVSGAASLGPTTISSLLLTSPLGVGSGGTGRTSLTQNGVVIGQGTNPLSTITAGSSGLCLMSTGGAPAFQACPGGVGSGVNSLNGLTGTLSIANATGVGTTITLDDASTTAKGIARFNATNFSVSSGVVNTVQNLAVTSSPTFAGLSLSAPLTVASGGTGANTLSNNGVIIGHGTSALTGVTAGAAGHCLVSTVGAPVFQACPGSGGVSSVNGLIGAITLNNSSTSGSSIIIDDASTTTKGIATFNATNFTASSGAINTIQNINTAATPTFGGLTTTGAINGQTISSTANFTGSLTVGGTLNVNTITPSALLTIGATGQALTLQGNGSTRLTATNSGIINSLVFASPSGSNKTITIPNASGTVAVSASGPLAIDANGNISCSTCALSGSGVTSLNSLTGALVLNNSSGAGSSITIDNASTSAKGIASFNSSNFSVASGAVNTIQDINTTAAPTFAGLTLSSALSVNSGGTGANTLTSNGVIIGNGTSALTSVAAGAAGQCLVSTAGSPIFTSCPGSGGVSSLNGLTGPLTLNNASAGGSSITIDDASTTVKGIASFNATNFTASSGAINTIQNINTAATPTFGGLTTTGAINGQTISNAANFTGSLTVGGALNVNTIAPSSALTIGSTGQALTLQGNGSTQLTATSGGIINSLVFATPASSNKTITIPNASGTLAVSASGPISLDANGNISCATCALSGSGVTSLNGLTGALTLNNSSSAGSSITIDDASTSSKGIASFNSSNFSVTNGAVNTIQDINTSAAPTFNGLNVTTTINGQTISSTANFTGSLAVAGTLNANTITPTGAMTIGATGQSLSLQGNASTTLAATNGANTTTLAFQSPTANVTYRLQAAAAGTYDVCTSAGNCSGSGGGVTTTGGTAGAIAKFSGAQTLVDSLLSESGSTITVNGTLAVNDITPTSTLTVGSTAETLILQGDSSTRLSATSGGITNSLLFTTPTGSNKSIILPDASGTVAVSASGPLTIDANGNIACTTCVTSGGSGGGSAAVDSLNGLTGGLSINNSTGFGTVITIDDASTTDKGIASFDSTNFSVTSGAVNTIQDIATSSTPTFNALNLSTALSVGNGGTGSTTASGARSNLGAAASGANSDITSLSGLTTALTVLQGGTGATTASGARSNLGAAASGANSDITSLSGLTTALSVLQGGTGSTTASGARSNLGAAASGANSDITSLSGLTTALSILQGGTGATTSQDAINGISQLTTNGDLLYFDGTNSTRLARGADGECLTSNTTTLQWGSCGLTAETDTLATVTGRGASTSTAVLLNGGATIRGLTVDTATATDDRIALNVTSGGAARFDGTITTADLTANRTWTLPDASGTLAVSASGNIALSAAGNITFTGQLAVANGGTGSSTASGARTNLGAAESGANSDITSLSGLTTALSVSQGGTGGVTSQAAINNLSQLTTTGDILYFDGTNSTRLARGTDGQCLTSNTTTLAWNSCGITAEADTLASVTGRGATTSTAVLLQGGATIRSATIDTATATDDKISLAVTTGGATSFTGTITAADLTAARTWTLPDESGTICLQGSTNCGFMVGSASDFIQNQNASQQSTSNYWISGVGRADTGLQAPSFDTASAGTMTLGGTNATSISLAQNTTVAAGKSLTLNGGNTGSRPASPTEGMLYYDTTTKKLLVYSNSKWQADRSSATKIVGTSASGGTSGAVASVDPDGADYVNTSTSSAQTTINSAISSLPSSGGTIYLMEGTYIIDNSINVPNNVTITGAGKGTIIKLANSVNAYVSGFTNSDTTTGTGVHISNLSIDGNRTNQTWQGFTGIHFNGMGGGSGTGARSGGKIDNVIVSNTYYFGITISNSSYTKVSGVSAINNRNDGVRITGTSSGNSITDSVANGNSVGFHLYGTNNSLTSSSAQGNSTDGINDEGDYNTISNNKTYGNSEVGIHLTYSSNSTVSGNISQGNTDQGIRAFSADTLTITGNTVRSNSNDGIQLSFTTNSVVSSNTAQANTQYGIQVSNGSQNTVSSNNVYDNVNDGIGLNSSTANNSFIGNTIRDTTGATYAIDIASGTSANYFADNNFSGTGAASIRDLGTGTIYGGQRDGNGNFLNNNNSAATFNTSTATSSLTLQGGLSNSQLPAPAQPTVTNIGTAGSTSYTYAVSALDGTGETLISTVRVTTTGNATLNGTNYNRVTWVQVPGAIQYKVYRTASSGTPSSTGLIGTVNGGTTVTFNDTGIAASGSTPAANTTGGVVLAGSLQGTSATLTGDVTVQSSTANTDKIAISITNGGSSSYTGTLTVADLTGARTWTLPDESGTICLQGSTNCGFMVGSASSFIQNQNSSQQATSNFWISGVGRADTALQAPSLDTAVSGTLSIGGTNATSISLAQDTSVAAGKSLTLTGGNTGSRPASPTEGMLYYDTTTKKLLVYSNSKWQADRSSATKIVGTSASGGTDGAVASVDPDGADYVNTSTTSAQTTINSALSSLPATGGTVYLMEGTYVVNDDVSIPNNARLIGAGEGTVLKMVSGMAAFNRVITNTDTSNGTNITISNLTVDGNTANQGSTNGLHAIYLNGMGGGTGATARIGAKISYVRIKDSAYHGVYLDNSSHGTITHTSATNSDGYGFVIGGTAFDNTISNSNAQGNGDAGFYVSGTNNVLSTNISRSNAASGFQIGGAGNTVSNNTITGNTAGIYSVFTTDTNIVGNTIQSNSSHGIQVRTGTGHNVTGNKLKSNSGIGIYLDQGASQTTVSGNTITSSGAGGIQTDGGSNNTIVGNTIDTSASYGLHVDTSTNTNIASNSFYNNAGTGATSSVRLTSADNNIITSNRITDTAGTGYAIDISSSASDANYLADNYFSGTGATSIRDLGTGTIYGGQRDGNGNFLNNNNSSVTFNTSTANSSLTLQGGFTNSQLPAPAQPTVATVGTAGSTSYSYAVSALDGTGETLVSTVRTIATGNATLNGTNYNRVTWVQVPGATQYRVYRTASSGTPSSTGLIGTVTGGATVTFNDTGIAASGSSSGSNTTGGATIAGTLQGSTSVLSPVFDRATAGTLSIGTATATAITIGKSGVLTTIAGTLTVSEAATFSGNLTVNGHLIGGGSTPSIAAGTAACTTPTVSVTGTDTAGTITVTTGTGCAGSGKLATVTFNSAFASAPRITLTPTSADAASLTTFIDYSTISTTTFDLNTSTTPTDSTTYRWYYHAIQ